MSDDRISAKDFPAVQQAKEATKKALEYYRRMSSMAYQITEPERTAAELQRLRAENERLRSELGVANDAIDLLRPDAERYRVLRSLGFCPWAETDEEWRRPARMDATLDMWRESQRRARSG